jgi:prepilin-type N-terminal cleavage/methylation domain-containing protein
MCHKRSFSLVELLVVISILAILTTLLNPSYSKMVNMTKRISCLSQLGQINQIQNIYADDHNGRYPASNPYNRRHLPSTWDKVTLYDPLTLTYGLKMSHFICPAKGIKPGLIRSGPWEGDMSIKYAYIAGLQNSNGNSYSESPAVAKLEISQNNAQDVVLADLNMSFYNYDRGIYNHSRDLSTEGVGSKNENLATMLYRLDGGNRISNDGSGQWIDVEQMGKDDQQPDLNDLTTAKYSHWTNLRPYYW